MAVYDLSGMHDDRVTAARACLGQQDCCTPSGVREDCVTGAVPTDTCRLLPAVCTA